MKFQTFSDLGESMKAVWLSIIGLLIISSPLQITGKTDPNPQMMAANFFNILINGILAASSNDDKEAQKQAVTAALVSVSNIVQLAFKSSGVVNSDQLAEDLCTNMLQPEVLEEIAAILKTEEPALRKVIKTTCI